MLTGVKYLRHVAPGSVHDKLVLRVSNATLASYLLKQISPRSPAIRLVLDQLWSTLAAFRDWKIVRVPARRTPLAGSPHSWNFPKGVFPWLRYGKASGSNGSLVITLPDDPAVRAQFLASITTAKTLETGAFEASNGAGKVIQKWLRMVTGGVPASGYP